MAASLVPLSNPPFSPPSINLPRPISTLPINNTTFLSSSQTLRSASQFTHRLLRRRAAPPVVRAAHPTASTLVLVFVLPLSLLIGTILVSLRIGQKLDEKFIEELAANQAMMMMMEEEDLEAREGEEEGVGAAGIRFRNRPKREV